MIAWSGGGSELIGRSESSSAICVVLCSGPVETTRTPCTPPCHGGAAAPGAPSALELELKEKRPQHCLSLAFPAREAQEVEHAALHDAERSS